MDPNHLNNSDQSALSSTWYYKNVEIIKYLIEKGADLNQPSKWTKETYIFKYTKSENLELVRMLLENGADPNCRDIYDETFLFKVCVEEGGLEMIKLLVEYGADLNIPNKKGETCLMWMYSWRS